MVGSELSWRRIVDEIHNDSQEKERREVKQPNCGGQANECEGKIAVQLDHLSNTLLGGRSHIEGQPDKV
jgi:hypothetical protein